MSEFDKWWEENSWDIENYYDAEKSFKAGQQSQKGEVDRLQTKIDELEFKLSSTVNNFDNSCKTIAIHQKFLDDADVANKFLTDKIDELQGRIDVAIGSLKLVNHALLYEHIDHIINLLDGTTNEQ